jgi:hypothetical protein
MKRFQKIFLFFLALIYITHTYSRLVHTPPIYVIVSCGESQKLYDNFGKKSKNAFILHLRHLPLTKKLVSEKLHPFVNPEHNYLESTRKSVYQFHELYKYYNSPLSNNLHNKAPPISS